MKEEVGRKPIEVLEIEQDFCDLTYGVPPCTAVLSDDSVTFPTATLNKCFNTLATCGDPDNYLAGVKILKFCSDQNEIPNDDIYYPFLKSIKIKAAEINPASANRAASGLGKRATISAKLTDHPSSDSNLDKYYDERLSGAAQFNNIPYNPIELSTFWRKWAARNFYYLYRNIRYISGYLEDGLIVDSITQSFIVTGFKGADNKGNVNFKGKDVLSLAQKEKASAPRASNGKLLANLSANAQNNVYLTPFGIGDLEYPTIGIVRIGKEICLMQRNFAQGDRMKLTRSQYNTEGEEHDLGDTVQLCLEYNAQLPYQILYSLLNDYSEIPDSRLDTAQWIQESVTDQYLPLAYTTLITEPTPVETLISEMCEQMYFYTWFDTRTDLVLIRAVRGIGEDEVTNLTFDENLIRKSIKITDQPEQIVTRVVINYGIWNPAESLKDLTNYRVSDIESDLLNEGVDRNRRSQTKTIFSRWLTPSAGAAAQKLGQNIIARYAVPPLKVDFALDAKDRDLWTGDFIQLTSPYVVDPLGNPETISCQIMKGKETKAGSVFSYSAQQFRFELPPVPDQKYLRLTANRNNLVLREWYDEQFPLNPPLATDNITFEIESSVFIGSASIGLPAFSVGILGAFPVGCVINVILTAPTTYIVGKGGQGGAGSVTNGLDGGAGGLGMLINFPINITNNGSIGGGGGGGGGGAGIREIDTYGDMSCGGGGGGGGAGQGVAGLGAPTTGGLYPSTPIAGVTGAVGAAPHLNGLGGTGGFTEDNVYNSNILGGGWREKCYATAGGNGGTMGVAGTIVRTGYPTQLPSSGWSILIRDPFIGAQEPEIWNKYAGEGGAAGLAINGVSNITWLTQGAIFGGQIN